MPWKRRYSVAVFGGACSFRRKAFVRATVAARPGPRGLSVGMPRGDGWDPSSGGRPRQTGGEGALACAVCIRTNALGGRPCPNAAAEVALRTCNPLASRWLRPGGISTGDPGACRPMDYVQSAEARTSSRGFGRGRVRVDFTGAEKKGEALAGPISARGAGRVSREGGPLPPKAGDEKADAAAEPLAQDQLAKRKRAMWRLVAFAVRVSRALSAPAVRGQDPVFIHKIVDRNTPPSPHCKSAGDIDGAGFPGAVTAASSIPSRSNMR